MFQWMLGTWTLVPPSFLNPACASGSSCFTYCWNLPPRILSTILWKRLFYLCSPSRWSFQCPDWPSWSSNEKKQNMITDTSHSVFPVVLDHPSLPGCISHCVIPVKSYLSGKACCSTVKMPHKTKSSLSSPAAWYISNRMTLVLYAWKSCIQDFTHSPFDVSGPTKSEWK